jgi:mannose-6-phosphate isomerase-like protein (cupin superfamily)
MTESKGIVVAAGGGKHMDMNAPGRFAAVKLVGHETHESIMMFEETAPVGTASWHHLHRDSDEVAWVLEGEFTFKIGEEISKGGPGTCAFFPRNVAHAWKNTGTTTGRVLFMYTPAGAGRYIEAMAARPNLSDAEKAALRERYNWEVLGPNPL